MAQYEQPVNLINFQEGQEPENKRIEEQFMYKYMQMRPAKPQAAKKGLEEAQTGVDDSDVDEDPGLEQFADAEMDREMKRMASGAPGGMPDSEDEEVSMEDEASEGSDAAEDDAGFFSGEDDLQEVQVSAQDDDEDDDDSEGQDLMSEDSYGAE